MSSSPADVLKAATSLFAFATDNDSANSSLSDSLKAATAITNLGDKETANVANAVQAATAVVTLGSDSSSSITDSWTKNAIISLKNHSDTVIFHFKIC
jgi:hypothetical protein